MMGSFIGRSFAAGAIAVVFFTAAPKTYSATALSPSRVLSDPNYGEQGWSVAVSGNRAIVGAPFLGSGRADIFDLNTGALLHQLQGSNTHNDSLFGASVAIDGNLAIVGCQQQDAAYVFDVTTGQELARLGSDSSYVHGFGYSVDISGDLAIVGAPFGGTGPYPYNQYIGSVYIFNAKTGAQLNRFVDPTFTLTRSFGGAVAIGGTTRSLAAQAWARLGPSMCTMLSLGSPSGLMTIPRLAIPSPMTWRSTGILWPYQ